MTSPPPPEHGADWIDVTVRLASGLGLNGVRVRWRLMRFQQSWQRLRHRAEQRALHVSYEHAVCPRCGRVQDRRERRCVGCGERLGGRSWQLLARLGVAMPSMVSMSSVIGFAILVVYCRLLLTPGAGGLLDVDTAVLIHLGAYWLPAIREGQIWRHATAIFLHIGLIHLAFNLMALAQVGPAVEDVFGRGRMLFIFMLTGIFGFVACQLVQLQAPSAGASGALMGLIGAAAGWGQRDGTSVGRDVRNRMVKWGAYTMVFGWFVHANNVAHGAGFVLGAVLGYLARPRWRRPRSAGDVLLGVLGMAALIAAVALVIHPPAWAGSVGRGSGRSSGSGAPAEREVLAVSPEQVTLIHSLCVEWVPVESGAPGTAGVLPFGASEAAVLDKVRQTLGRSDLSDRAALQTYRDAMRALEIFVGRAELAPGRYRYANPLSEEELAQQPFIAHKLVERDGNTIAVEVRAEHLKLLRHANLELLEGGEGQLLFEIDPKRPYGDMTNFYLDMGDLLGIHPAGRPHLGQRADEFTDEQIRQLDQLHETMEPVLQVFLREAKFEPGTFVRDGSGPWKRR